MRNALLLAVVLAAIPCRADDADALYREGKKHYDQNRMPDAVRFFEQGLAAAPDNALLRKALANSCVKLAGEYAMATNYPDAVALARKAVKTSPDMPVCRQALSSYSTGLAAGMAARGEYAEAIAALKTAMDADPDNDNLKKSASNILLMEALRNVKSGAANKALPLLKAALAQNPGNLGACLHLAELFYVADDLPSAIEYWKRAKDISPDCAGVDAKIEKAEKDMSVQKGFSDTARSHFLVKYEGVEREDLAWKAVRFLEDAYRDIGRLFDKWPEDKVVVIIYTRDQYKQVTGMADWRIGLFDGKIRVAAGNLTLPDSLLREVLVHEYTHSLVHIVYGPGMPVWLHEGLAQLYASPLSQTQKAAVRKMIETGIGRPPWERNEDFRSSNGETIASAYLVARLFTKYMFDRYDNHTARLFAKEVAADRPVAEIFRELFNRTPDEMIADWTATLKDAAK